MNAENTFISLGGRMHASQPAAHYVNVVRSGNLLFLAGKIAPPLKDGTHPKGKLGAEFTTEQGYQFARGAALDLLSVVRAELGTLDKVVRIVKLTGFIRATDDFEEHPKVLDGASDLLVEVFGERGLHARSVLGVVSLRGGAPIVLEGIVEV